MLTGETAGDFSRSYQIDPLHRFGARASKLTKLLDRGHYDVKLSPGEWERIVTWIDANALFYGTFEPEDQAKQRRGERIAGPDLE